MKQARLRVDLEAVVAAELVFASAAAHQFVRHIALQILNSREFPRGRDLFLCNARHAITSR